MSFGENLIKYRKLRGITQEKMAEIMQVSRQSVSKWENDEMIPELTKMIKLADVLEVSLDELCGRIEGTIEDKGDTIVENSKDVEKSKKKSVFSIVLALILVVICVVVSAGIGYGVGEANASSAEFEKLLNASDVGNVEYSYDAQRNLLTCKFIPDVYSENLEYTLLVTDEVYHQMKEYDVEFENGVGTSTMTVYFSRGIDIVLRISDGKNIRNITIADNLSEYEVP